MVRRGDGLGQPLGMMNATLFVPVFPEFVLIPLRPCNPNICVPLEKVAVRTALKCIGCEMALYEMLAHILKSYVKSPIFGCPSAFQIAWPAVRNLVQFQCMLLDLDRCSTNWNFKFDLKTQVGAPCSPDIRLQ